MTVRPIRLRYRFGFAGELALWVPYAGGFSPRAQALGGRFLSGTATWLFPSGERAAVIDLVREFWGVSPEGGTDDAPVT